MPGLERSSPSPVYSRTFHIGPRTEDMILQVAHREEAKLVPVKGNESDLVLFGPVGKEKPSNSEGSFSFDGATYLQIGKSNAFDMIDKDYTILARIKTNKGGTIFSKTSPGGEWVRDGKALFVRGRRLVFDIGWVGMVSSREIVADSRWHDVAMTYEHKTGQVRLYIDGKLDGERRLKPKARVKGHVARIGFAAPDFPERQSFFVGQMEEVRFFQRQLTGKEIQDLAKKSTQNGLAGQWKLSSAKGKQVLDESKNKHHAKVVFGQGTGSPQGILAAGLWQAPTGSNWLQEGNNLRLRIPAGKNPLKFTLWFSELEDQGSLAKLHKELPDQQAVVDLTSLTQGGPKRWSTKISTVGELGKDEGPFAVDVLKHPTENPWACRVRLGGFDFFPDGDRAAVCSWDGDVWLVTGVNHPEKGLTWQRIASGLFQPLGLKIVDGQIYVCCRDQIVILHDLNGDGETDFYENFNNDHQVTDHFHEFAMGLQTDKEGNFYYARGARHALKALVPQHGTLLKVNKEGTRTEILATGFRAPNGVCLNPDGTFFVTDQEGHWNPKNRINWVVKGGFYGNMWGYHDVTDSSDEAMEPPLCWITNNFDRSPAELLWVTSKKWGSLHGSLLNLSYGYGKILIVPHEKIKGKLQGGVCELPLPRFPTGIMRGRFHPENGQLYACGLFGWAGNQHQPGGFYRVRYTGKPVHVPVGLQAKAKTLSITFSDKLNPESATDKERFRIKIWDLKRSRNYGSKHYNEKYLPISSAQLSKDGKTVSLEFPALQPTWCMEIRYNIESEQGKTVSGVIHNTIHELGE